MDDAPTRENQPADWQPGLGPTRQPGRRRQRHAPAPPPTPRRKARRKGRRLGCLKTGLIISAMVLAALAGSGLVVGLLVYDSLANELAGDIERLNSMEGVENFQTTRIYDRTGSIVLYEVFSEGRRTEVDLEEIPLTLQWATIATEDNTFYDNPGFNPPSILRAAWQWVQQGEIVSGGSTITQQLVRQIVFDYEERNEQTLRRKLKEAALAWVMTRQHTKQDILELYLNEIYYGNLAYGIGEASRVYFDKDVTQLTRGEAAFLAGLPQSPYTYDPYTNFTGAKLRQRQVLDLMVLHGYLSLAQADEIFNQPPLTVADLASPDVALEAPHFTVEVRRQLESLPGLDPEMITRGGLSVYTTLDMDLQKLGEQIVAERIAEVRDEFNMTNAALVALSPHTGEVLALVGSVDYHDEAIDGAVNNILSPHQPGSTMKPLTYAAALELGWEPADVLWDVPITYDLVTSEYEPVNYDERFHGPVRLRDALARSYNVPAVMLLNEVGVDRLLELAARFGVQSLGTDPAQYGLSLTLGGGEVQPMEMAIAFGVFASGGYRVQPVMITRVVDSDGNLLYEAPGGQGEQVLDPRIAFMISDILSDNDARAPAMGIDSPLLLDGIVAAAKTGTTNDFRDNWTVGYTPHLVVAVWAGNTDNEPMAEGTSGLAGAAPIWNQFMTEAYALTGLALLLERPGLPPLRSAFTPPASLEQRQVCVISTLRDPVPAEEGCSQTRSEWFRTGDGGIEIKPTDVPTPTPAPTVEGDEEPLPPMREEIERGLLRIGVFALSEGDQRDQQVEALAGVWEALPGSAPEPVPPPYCVIPQSATGIELEDVAFQVFIAAPRDPLTALYARNWAYQNGVPIDPGYECPPELVDELLVAEPITDPATGAVYAIDDPNPGEEVYGVVPVIGTALFDPEIVDFYKIEIGPGETPGAWITLGGIYEQGVEDSVLEYLHADASDILPPGPYVLRLVLVLPNGDILPPYEVPITIVPVPQDEDG